MAGLRSLEVELEAVTPLWIGGASRQAELRPPSVRGCLRFWFRALAGGLLGEELRTVCEAESAVFGNTTRASSVVVRLFGSPRTGVSVVGETEQLPGLAYMFWSVFTAKARCDPARRTVPSASELPSLPVCSRRGRGAYLGDGRKLRDGGGLVMAAGPPGRGWCPHAARGRRNVCGRRSDRLARLPAASGQYGQDTGRAGRGAERWPRTGAPGRRMERSPAHRSVELRHSA